MKIQVDSEKTKALLKLVLNTFGSQNGNNSITVEFDGKKEKLEAMDVAVDLKRSIEVITEKEKK